MSEQTTGAGQPPIIVTDTACDLLPDFVKEYDVKVAPLTLMFGEESYRSGVDITHAQFYERLAHGDVHPTTSQPTIEDFASIYREVGQAGTPILSIHLSEGLSGTVNVARRAAQEVSDKSITVWDGGTLSVALGLQVMTAARAARAGYTIEQILPLLKETHANGDLLFTVEDLTYLHRGGRIGSVRYQIGQVLHIKPIVTVSKSGDTAGTYVSAGRTRSLSKAVDLFADRVAEAVGEGNAVRAMVVHGDDSTLAERLAAQLDERFDMKYLAVLPVAPVLGVHVGPGALGIGFVPGDWPV